MSTLGSKCRTGLKMLASQVRERRLRMPSPFFLLSPASTKVRTPELRHLAQQMRRDGIVKLQGFIDPETLADMQAGIERMVTTMDERRKKDPDYDANVGKKAPGELYPHSEDSTESWYDHKLGFYSSLDAFKYSTGLARFATSDKMVSLVNSYYRKQAYITRAMAFRNLPLKRPRGCLQYIWHHDNWGRKVDATVILSEIGENDQYVSYKKGSHRLYHGNRVVRSGPNYSDEEIERDFPEYETLRCTGKPGDVYLFDANGLHTANSSEGRIRDIFLLMYYCDPTYIYRQTIPDQIMQNGGSGDLRVLKQTIELIELKRRRGDSSILPLLGLSWNDTLRHVRHWLL